MVIRTALGTRLGLLEDETFVRGHLWPFVAPQTERAVPGSVVVKVRRTRPDGRRVAEYRFDGKLALIAKLYSDAGQGLAVNGIQRTLWDNGFGLGSPYRVPEPIAYLSDYGVLVMHVAPGEPLRHLMAGSWDKFKEGLIGAARWLAALHAWPYRVGPVREVADDFSRLARLQAAAAACKPDAVDVFKSASHELMNRYTSAGEGRTWVQTHGRYHADHVVVAPDSVTVLDLDRVGLSDPARDVGEFLHRLRLEGGRMDLSRALVDEATETLVREYIRSSGADLSGLPFYWSYSVLSTLLRGACKAAPHPGRDQRRLRFLRKEFEEVPARASSWLGRSPSR
jgi:hypothetical protein